MDTNYLLQRLASYRGIAILVVQSSAAAERKRLNAKQIIVKFPPD